MSYELEFTKAALRKFNKLDHVIRNQFADQLEKVLKNPRIAKNKLRAVDAYKIKLRAVGYRLIYTVDGQKLVVRVVEVERRDQVYKGIQRLLS
tara:strand:+ start:349 stop:627 length:279 start_codon:yes stop_codon:yes gene_type:complete